MENQQTVGAGHFLLAGTGRDARFLGRLAGGLPEDSYGQLFLETPERSRIMVRRMPPLLAASWLPCDLAGLAADSPLPGERLAGALRAWAAEWLPEPGHQGSLPFTIWIGAAGNPYVDEVCHELLSGYPGLHMHRPEPVHTWEA